MAKVLTIVSASYAGVVSELGRVEIKAEVKQSLQQEPDVPLHELPPLLPLPLPLLLLRALTHLVISAVVAAECGEG